MPIRRNSSCSCEAIRTIWTTSTPAAAQASDSIKRGKLTRKTSSSTVSSLWNRRDANARANGVFEHDGPTRGTSTGGTVATRPKRRLSLYTTGQRAQAPDGTPDE